MELTPERARLLCETFNIDFILEDEEEVELLKRDNPELLNAAMALYEIAKGG